MKPLTTMKTKNIILYSASLSFLNAEEQKTLQGGSTDPVNTDLQNFIRMMDRILREQQ